MYHCFFLKNKKRFKCIGPDFANGSSSDEHLWDRSMSKEDSGGQPELGKV